MKSIFGLALVLCLVVMGCQSAPAPDAGNPPPSDTGTDPGTTPDATPLPGPLPTATFTMRKTGLRADFDASGVSSPSFATGDLLVRWDYTNDGTFDTDWSTTKAAHYTYPADGQYTVKMEVKDPEDQTDSATKLFNITAVNTPPTAVFNVNIVKGMTASLDASSSSDAEDPPEDLLVRWDFDGDNNWDTDWLSIKTMDYTYPTACEYTIKLQVKDLNQATKSATQTIVASPITIRNCFITYGPPYMVGLHFRMINNITEQPVTPADVPALTRSYFTIFEDNLPIDLSETNQILYSGKRPMMHMVLLLDFTGSMYDAGAVNPMIQAAKAFIESQSRTNFISLWAFWERQGGYTEITDFTSCDAAGKAALKTALDNFASADRDRGATEIWDVLKEIITTKFSIYDTGENRGIAFLSDGHDTTSVTTIVSLIEEARKRAAFMFSVGMAFRPDQYPADESNLKRIAEDTGGLYFTVKQVSDLATVFNQLSEDVNADWTLSYITLEISGTHTVKTVCNYLDGYATMAGKLPVTKFMDRDIRQGLLLAFPAIDSPVGKTEFTIYADYIPRGISTFKIRATSASPVTLTLYDTDSICKPSDGWSIWPDVAAGQAVPADGWYTISCITPLEYGSWGRLAKCTVDGVGLLPGTVHLEVPPLVPDQATIYIDKTIVFVKPDVNGDVISDIFVDIPYPL